jgi:hypothetical protein
MRDKNIIEPIEDYDVEVEHADALRWMLVGMIVALVGIMALSGTETGRQWMDYFDGVTR